MPGVLLLLVHALALGDVTARTQLLRLDEHIDGGAAAAYSGVHTRDADRLAGLRRDLHDLRR